MIIVRNSAVENTFGHDLAMADDYVIKLAVEVLHDLLEPASDFAWKQHVAIVNQEVWILLLSLYIFDLFGVQILSSFSVVDHDCDFVRDLHAADE